ncbi:17824_t:CDS:2, partial [Acaulospora morrowiae]
IDKELLEYNRDQLFDKYFNKFKDWKNNQPINDQYRRIAGYLLLVFYGNIEENPEEWIRDFT